jgi:hypothetical protein
LPHQPLDGRRRFLTKATQQFLMVGDGGFTRPRRPPLKLLLQAGQRPRVRDEAIRLQFTAAR